MNELLTSRTDYQEKCSYSTIMASHKPKKASPALDIRHVLSLSKR